MSFRLSNFYCFTLSFLLVLTTPSFAENILSKVSYIDSLAQVSIQQDEHDPRQTIVLLDLDDTLMDCSSSMVGTRAWRRYLSEATKKMNTSENWHDIFSLAIARKYPMQTVEEMTHRFIEELQDQGYVVCGFTARERQYWYDMPMEDSDVLTVQQLHSINIDFNQGRLERTFPRLSLDSEYFKGIFFTNLENKGEYILHLFENNPHLPEKIIFIDDKKSQVKSVASALDKLGILYECYVYTCNEKKQQLFNPLIANIQLYYFYQSHGQWIISDQEAEEIAKRYPEKDADFYFRAALEVAKKSYLFEHQQSSR